MRGTLRAAGSFREPPSFFKGWLFLLPLLLLVAACSPDKKAKQEKPRAVPVVAATAVQKEMPVQINAIGNVEAYSTVSVRAQVGGQLSRIFFKEGEDVNKGDPLFTIDPRPFEASFRQAEAALAKDAAQRENARKDAQRYEELVKKGYVARSQYEQFRTAAEALDAVVEADTAAVESARLQLSYCFLRAPVSGRTGRLLVYQGNLIKANDDNAMVVINQIQPINVAFSVPEQQLPEIKEYSAGRKLRVDAVIAQDALHPVTGELTFIDNAVDTTTGTIRLKATFRNREKRLWPGQFVNVVLRLTVQPDAVVVPTPAVLTGQQGQYIFVIKSDSTVESRPVEVSRTLGSETVIGRGVRPGERVVTDGQSRLVPGATVEVKAAPGGEKAKG
ncbi:MAG: efflux RND transporter periplasmic adaptor subunit [Nitrospirales bacterium]|nr:efflux RND transporter periplasmic adaptor subunit [Nitrospirales bacterium]